MVGPRYTGKHLHTKVRELLGETRLHETVTEVVIPAFDITLLQPTIFSRSEVYITTISLKIIVIVFVV
jgi:hypothetical protein